MASPALGIVLGLVVGLRHAFEPDHLSAVSTLISESRGVQHGALLGALWGLGHTLSLVAVGVILALVGATLPARAGTAFELAVAVMLLVLGARSIAVAMRGAAGHAHAPMTAGRRRRWRPFAVGLVHGLAGSGALTAVVFAQLAGSAARIAYMVLFGAGSIAGMGDRLGHGGRDATRPRALERGAPVHRARNRDRLHRGRHGVGRSAADLARLVPRHRKDDRLARSRK